MASKVIKCNSCNIVICEVLAFIQNKQNVMDADSIVKVCSSAFSPTEIATAKSLLFETLSSKQRKIVRRSDGKTLRDLNDVISIFRKTEPEELPSFVAKDLHRLPPLTFDHVDCTRLLKDILILKNEISTIKDTYVTEQQLNDIKNEVLNLKQASLVNNFEFNINRKRGGGGIKDSFYLNSGPIGLGSFVEKNREGSCSTPNSEIETTDNVESANRMVLSPSPQQKPHTPERERCSVKAKEPTLTDNAFVHSLEEGEAQIHAKPVGGVWPKLQVAAGSTSTNSGNTTANKSDSDWKLVQKKKKNDRLRGTEGKAEIRSDGKFKAAESRTPLFVNRVDKQTSGDDIIEYIKEHTGVLVDLKKINIRKEKRYDAYKIFVPHTKLSLFLDDRLWPKGIRFRRFVYFDRNTYRNNNRKDKISDMNKPFK